MDSPHSRYKHSTRLFFLCRRCAWGPLWNNYLLTLAEPIGYLSRLIVAETRLYSSFFDRVIW